MIKDKIVIRASSIEDALDCGWKWFNEHAIVQKEDIIELSGFRAAIGTAIHVGVETLWNSKRHIIGETLDEVSEEDLDMMVQSGLDCFDKEAVKYGAKDTKDSGHADITNGIMHYAKTLAIWVPVPEYVELNLTMDYKGITLSGTIDYLGSFRIEDVKTSKRPISKTKHIIQQSTYTMLGRNAGYTINENRLQAIQFKAKSIEADLIPIEINIPRVEYYLDTIVAKLKAVKEGADPKVVFHANPKTDFCFGCSLYPCPATQLPKPYMDAI